MDWQPIATAPRDATREKEGTWILVFWPDSGIGMGRWRFNPRNGVSYFTGSQEWDDYEMADYPPTHWMPLPDSPSAQDPR